MIITKLKCPLITIDLCMLIRFGKFKSTPEVRAIAKMYSFARVYGLTSFFKKL